MTSQDGATANKAWRRHMSPAEMAMYPTIVDLIRDVHVLNERLNGLCAVVNDLQSKQTQYIKRLWHETD